MTVRSRPENSSDWIVVGSRSHQPDDCKSFIGVCSDAEMPLMGSSVNLCFIAEGKADLYPRLGPIFEWDPTTFQVIVKAAVGQALRRYFVAASENIAIYSLHY